MYKQSPLPLLLILLLLALPVGVAAGDEAEPVPDSFTTLAAGLLSALEEIESGTVLAVPAIRNTDGRNSVLGNYLEDRFAALLISDSPFSVVERSQIDQIEQEWKYSLSGMLADESMYEIGNMAGADAVLIGILTRVDQFVQVNLRIVDTESALALASVDGLLTEPRYLSMYLDLFDTKPVTDEDFFIGRGRDFDRERAFLSAFIDLCRAVQEETGTSSFLDLSFVDFLEAGASLEFTRGSRYNCTLQIRRDQFTPDNLYHYFFRDGRSQTVWYYDEKNYGWKTNPWFQELVESGYDTLGVPEAYREAAARSAVFSAAEDPEVGFGTVEDGIILSPGTGSTPEWALLDGLMRVALMLETRIELVNFRGEEGTVDFSTEYTPLANLVQVSENYESRDLREAEDGYRLSVAVDAAE